MRKLLIFLFVSYLLTSFEALACDNSTFSITNQVSNPDGSVTYTLDVYTDLGALDAVFFGFAISFNSAYNTPTVILGGTYPTTSSLTDGDLTCGNLGGATLTALTGSDINSINGDSDWSPYENQTNVISFEDGTVFGSASNDICYTIQVTVMGCVEEIELNAHVNNGGLCMLTESTGVNCEPCSIGSITTSTQTNCDPGTNTYEQVVTITYTAAPGTGTLDVNGQSFPITSSPQSVNLVGLTADGNSVDVTAVFSDDPSCTFTSNGAFTAPPSCSTPCTPDNGTWD